MVATSSPLEKKKMRENVGCVRCVLVELRMKITHSAHGFISVCCFGCWSGLPLGLSALRSVLVCRCVSHVLSMISVMAVSPFWV